MNLFNGRVITVKFIIKPQLINASTDRATTINKMAKLNYLCLLKELIVFMYTNLRLFQDICVYLNKSVVHSSKLCLFTPRKSNTLNHRPFTHNLHTYFHFISLSLTSRGILVWQTTHRISLK